MKTKRGDGMREKAESRRRNKEGKDRDKGRRARHGKEWKTEQAGKKPREEMRQRVVECV